MEREGNVIFQSPFQSQHLLPALGSAIHKAPGCCHPAVIQQPPPPPECAEPLKSFTFLWAALNSVCCKGRKPVRIPEIWGEALLGMQVIWLFGQR